MNFFKKLFFEEQNQQEEINKIQTEKSMGPLQYLYKNGPYKKIGPQPEDFVWEDTGNNSEEIFKQSSNLLELKKQLYSGIGPQIRPLAWKVLFKYAPFKKDLREKVFEKKRNEYKEYKIRYEENKLLKENEPSVIQMLQLIKKDIYRTLQDSHLFKNEQIQKSMIRILLHPSNLYSQGMNDILAPIFACFVSGQFGLSYLELVNNMSKHEEDLIEDKLLNAEADAFYCFGYFLSTMKQNYTKQFEGANMNLNKVNQLLQKADKNLYQYLTDNDIQLEIFAFRWVFCLLMREFPIHLSIKLMDYYLTEEMYPSEFCVYIVLALIMRFSYQMKTMQKDELILFMSQLPTFDWGYKDIELLVSEAYVLKQLFKLQQLNYYLLQQKITFFLHLFNYLNIQ